MCLSGGEGGSMRSEMGGGAVLLVVYAREGLWYRSGYDWVGWGVEYRRLGCNTFEEEAACRQPYTNTTNNTSAIYMYIYECLYAFCTVFEQR